MKFAFDFNSKRFTSLTRRSQSGKASDLVRMRSRSSLLGRNPSMKGANVGTKRGLVTLALVIRSPSDSLLRQGARS